MKYLQKVFILTILFFSTLAFAEAPNPLSQLAWQVGPAKGKIGDKAIIEIPEGYAFLDAANTKKFMEMNHNLAGDDEYLITPQDLSWFAVLKFNPVGYVKDDETLEADSLLTSIKQGTAQANTERRQRGWDTLSVLGWRFPPQYDSKTKLLEWALKAKNDSTNAEIVNYNTRLLGRTGVMEVTLVSNPMALDTSVQSFKSTLNGFEYVPGERYAEFTQGDHVAEFGLGALVAGGVAAVAAKKGFFAVIGAFLATALKFAAAAWKLVLVAIAGAFAWIKSLFSKKQ